MSDRPLMAGDRVAIGAGKYTGLTGVVVDPTTDGKTLPAPLPGHCWIRVTVENISIPVHVHNGVIQTAP